MVSWLLRVQAPSPLIRKGCPLPLTRKRLVGSARSSRLPPPPPPVVTETLVVPLCPPRDAVTVKGPPALPPAVKRPLELMLPPPLTVQLRLRLVVLLPN